MVHPLTGAKTLLTLLTGLLMVNAALLGWSMLDGLYVVRSQAQQTAERSAARLAARLEQRPALLRERDALSVLLADLAPDGVAELQWIGPDASRTVALPPLAPLKDAAPAWYSALLVGPPLQVTAPLPQRAEQLALTFDSTWLATPFWHALRVPWLMLNLALLVFVLGANAWMGRKLARLQRSTLPIELTPVLRELLREELPAPAPVPAAARPAEESSQEAMSAYASGAALLYITHRGVIGYANPAALTLLGYDNGELLGKPAERLLPPWRQTELSDEQRSDTALLAETQRLTRRGHLVDVLWSSVPVRNAEGEICGRVWTLWDISERKRDEQILRLLGRGAELSGQGLLIIDAGQDNAAIFVNEAVARISGHARSELLGRNPLPLLTDDADAPELRELRAALERGEAHQTLLPGRRKDGTPYSGELTLTPLHDSNQRLTHFIALLRDVSSTRQQLGELQRHQGQLRQVVDDAPLAIAICDSERQIRAVNPFFAHLFGLRQEQLLNHPLHEVIAPAAWQQIRPSSGAVGGGEITLPRKSGEPLTVLANVSELDNDGGAPYTVLYLVDITGRKRAEQALAEQRERAQVTLESIGDGVITTNAQGIVDYINPVAERLTGLVKEDVQGMPVGNVFKLLDEETREPLQDPVERALRLGRTITVSRRAVLVSSDAREFGLHITATPIRDREQKIIGAVVIFRDVSESRAAERQITYQARYDALTGLFNRREFQTRLEQALVSARDENRHHVLGYLDLDKFKPINDTGGHAAGDEALKQIAALIQAQLREVDVLARLGGDEFAILLYSCTMEAAEGVAEHIRAAIGDYRFLWENLVFDLGVSIGLVPIGADAGSLDDVLHAADTACYLAKNAGRNRVHVYQAERDAGAEPTSATLWLQRIQEGIEQDRFVLFEQRADRISGTGGPHYRSLTLRLHDERGELVPASAFLPTAERYQMLNRIDEWTVSTLLSRLGRQAEENVVYGVRLSSQSVTNPTFAPFVLQQLERSGAAAGAVCFEIGEADLVTNLTNAMQLMQTLHGAGCRFAFDHFGYSRSSFAHLHHLPIDFLKLEGSVIQSLFNNPVDYVIADTIARVGQLMGILTIATDVNDGAILERLKQLHIDYAQGDAVAAAQPWTGGQRD